MLIYVNSRGVVQWQGGGQRWCNRVYNNHGVTVLVHGCWCKDVMAHHSFRPSRSSRPFTLIIIVYRASHKGLIFIPLPCVQKMTFPSSQ